VQLSAVVGTGRRVAATAKRTQVSFLAAGIAYYMLVSLFPLGLLALVLATVVGGEALADQIVRSLGAVLSPGAADVLRGTLLEARGRAGVTVLGIVVLLWSGLRVFRGLDVAFSLVYGTDEVESLPEQLRDALAALSGITVAVIALAVVNALVVVSGIQLAGVLGAGALAAMLTVAFLPIYYVFPDTDVTLRAVLPGTFFAAVGWTLLGALFSLYASVATGYELYGVVGGILLLVTWFYFASVVLLLGAVVNVVRRGGGVDRQLQQAAVRNDTTMTGEDGADGETPPPADAGRAGVGASSERSTGGDSRGAGPTGAGETPPPNDPDDRDNPTQEELEELRDELDAFRADVEDRTLHREEIEDDLRRYVRRRLRRGHARGWGPYVVLLYGTVMTLGAFYYLQAIWAILAMGVVWLSTLGLYVMMVLAGIGFGAAGLPRRLLDRFRD
jgi:YihY family inner membrane protein